MSFIKLLDEYESNGWSFNKWIMIFPMKMDENLMKIWPKYTSTISCLIILSQQLGTLVESGLGSSSKSGTEQFVSFKNELKLMNTVGSFCSVSNSSLVNGGEHSNYLGLRDFLVNLPISRRWYCKVAIFSDWVKASYFVSISEILFLAKSRPMSEKIIF